MLVDMQMQLPGHAINADSKLGALPAVQSMQSGKLAMNSLKIHERRSCLSERPPALLLVVMAAVVVSGSGVGEVVMVEWCMVRCSSSGCDGSSQWLRVAVVWVRW